MIARPPAPGTQAMTPEPNNPRTHGGTDAEAAPAARGRHAAGRAGTAGAHEPRPDGAALRPAAADASPHGGARVSSRHPTSESGGVARCGLRRDGASECGGGAEDGFQGAEDGGDAGCGGGARQHVPASAADGVDGVAAPESRDESVARGAVAAACAELERHAAVDDDSDAVKRREVVIQREFAHHHPGVARLNNGSFGSAPRRVLDDQAEWNVQWLRHPDAFCWGPLSNGFLAARQGLAELIGDPDVEEVVLLENATTGAAIVAVDCMWGFLEGRFERGDGIVMFDSTYGAVKKCFQVNLGLLNLLPHTLTTIVKQLGLRIFIFTFEVLIGRLAFTTGLLR